MRAPLEWALISIVVAVGCTGPARTNPGPQTPTPIPSSPAAENQRPRSWTFSYEPGVTTYRIVRHATIEAVNGSLPSPSSDTSENITHEILSLERIGDSIGFSLVADTFATTAPGRAGAVQHVELPVQVQGWMTRDSLTFTRDSTGVECSPSASAVESDLQSLLVRFPAVLTRGMTWQDSVELKGCQAAIPTTGRITRSFRVVDESNIDTEPTLAVERTDTVQAHGEGAQQQHRVVLDASGTGRALYHLRISDGRLVLVTSDQQLNLTMTTTENTAHFRQTLKQEAVLVR
jgi:hypothetical protein